MDTVVTEPARIAAETVELSTAIGETKANAAVSGVRPP
jgi:hypothetical protein